ncbi:MAG: hypothetical protein UY04_C0027G0005 [Parcubacteria group bacterium GW2011_GWA2_47_7]|nr:MAG: hypothetical protein UY04_C0027G0005 [Parcubacteria group bacterium GW2011_GWA2_47_7]
MDTKLIWLGLFVGSLVGSFVPLLWGGSTFSMTSVFTSAGGSIIGVWLAFRFTRY